MAANSMAPTAVGLVLRRSARQLATEPFYVELIAGMEHVLLRRGLHVLMQVVDGFGVRGMDAEIASYQRWFDGDAVRGVVLVDLVPDDPRPEILHRLGLPAIIVGEPGPDAPLPSVRTDGYSAIREAVSRLAALGHRRIARVTGLTGLVHTRERTRAFYDAASALGLSPLHAEGDYSAESGASATQQLLAQAGAPTAIIYDNDVMALAGLDVARSRGIHVPDALSILAWDDSHLCRLATPPLSAMSHDVNTQGMLAARLLLEVLDGNQPADAVTPKPVFLQRGTTAEHVTTVWSA
ncbi:MAG TPA: substrate-binding domain-containing protein [Rugosimonospora sp.]